MTENYDSLDRLKILTNTLDTDILSKFEYDYDKNGNVIEIVETVINSGVPVDKITNIGYDKLNRISWVESGEKTAVYSYDSRGNRKTEHTTDISFDESEFSYVYDDLNRLTSAEKTDGNTTVTTLNEYTADGLRYSKSVNGVKTQYIYDNEGRISAESANGTITSNYIHAPDRTLAKISGSDTYYYLYNGHGDVVQIIDTYGDIVNSYGYDLWGNFEEKEETVHNPFTYFGQQFDESTGLYYLRARYYDPTIGRFTQEDPIKDGNNWYVYCNGNPVIWLDPSGKIVTSWDRAVLPQSFVKKLQEYTDGWAGATKEQQDTWRDDSERMRAMYRNDYEYTENGITKSTETGNEIRFKVTSQEIGTATFIVEAGYSFNKHSLVELSIDRQTVAFISNGFGIKHSTETQSFTTDGYDISYTVTYSITATVQGNQDIFGGEVSFGADGGKITGTLYIKKRIYTH